MTRLSKHMEKEKELKKRMRRLKVFEKDIKEGFVRSSGPGGQNVNKVSTCVNLIHIPTGIAVKCQASRNQSANRFKARLLLVDKIEKDILEKERSLRHKEEKKKRQTRKRPADLKEKILQQKHIRSDKKTLRKKIDLNDVDVF